MSREKVVRVQIEAGKATTSPPLGPALADLGLNVSEVIQKINEITKPLEGHIVTVKIVVDLATKEYKIDVKLPTTTSLLLKAVGADRPTGNPAQQKLGNVSLEKIIEIALLKKKELTAKSLKGAVKTILGSAHTLGILVDGKEPKQLIKEIDEGLYNDVLLKYEEKWRQN
ncbi:MAG: 50S ribosomal protein L11 [Thermoprotei archaeon]|nr:MAG: 50S ribosomal protein L11 [Thermoprotei archaeon]